MRSFEWLKQESDLALREDDFSWQGSYIHDRKFFIRRDKITTNLLTDLIVGDLKSELVSELLAEFLKKTGRIRDNRLTIGGIATRNDSKETVVDAYDQTIKIVDNALTTLGYTKLKSHLEQDGNKWSALVYIEHTPKH